MRRMRQQHGLPTSRASPGQAKSILHCWIPAFAGMTVLMVGGACPTGTFAAGQYQIDWYTIDSGGGTSSGGRYVLMGTVGQADAAYSSSDKYEVLGGFWPGGPVECFPSCHKDYAQWVSVSKPDCWCYPRQCHGDADGKAQGSEKTGIYYVGTNDLNILIAAWQVKEPPNGPGIASIQNGICADFARDQQGSAKTGLMRVSTNDLNILIANWLVKEPPKGPGTELDCLDCP